MDALTLLIFTIALCILVQPTHARKEVCFVFAAAIVLYEGCFTGLDGFWLFFSAGLFDAAVVLILAGMAHTALTIPIQLLCLASLLANGAGWLMWSTYIDPVYYNTFYLGLYAVAILTMLRGTDVVGKLRTATRLPWVPRADFAHGAWRDTVRQEGKI